MHSYTHTHTYTHFQMGGIKTNIGHAEPVAGLTGLMRLCVGFACSVVPDSKLLHMPKLHMQGMVQWLGVGDAANAMPQVSVVSIVSIV